MSLVNLKTATKVKLRNGKQIFLELYGIIIGRVSSVFQKVIFNIYLDQQLDKSSRRWPYVKHP